MAFSPGAGMVAELCEAAYTCPQCQACHTELPTQCQVSAGLVIHSRACVPLHALLPSPPLPPRPLHTRPLLRPPIITTIIIIVVSHSSSLALGLAGLPAQADVVCGAHQDIPSPLPRRKLHRECTAGGGCQRPRWRRRQRRGQRRRQWWRGGESCPWAAGWAMLCVCRKAQACCGHAGGRGCGGCGVSGSGSDLSHAAIMRVTVGLGDSDRGSSSCTRGGHVGGSRRDGEC